MEEPRALVGARPEQRRISAPDAARGRSPDAAQTSSAISRPTGVPETTADLGAEHAQVVERAPAAAPRLVRGVARRPSRSTTVAITGHEPDQRALRHRRCTTRVVGDGRGVVGREHGAPRLGRERLGCVAADDVERRRVGAAERRHGLRRDAVDDRQTGSAGRRSCSPPAPAARWRGRCPPRAAADLVRGRDGASRAAARGRRPGAKRRIGGSCSSMSTTNEYSPGAASSRLPSSVAGTVTLARGPARRRAGAASASGRSGSRPARSRARPAAARGPCRRPGLDQRELDRRRRVSSAQSGTRGATVSPGPPSTSRPWCAGTRLARATVTSGAPAPASMPTGIGAGERVLGAASARGRAAASSPAAGRRSARPR